MGHPAGAITDQRGVTGARQGQLRALLLEKRLFLARVALDHAVHSPAQPEGLQLALQNVVLSFAFHRLPGDAFIFHPTENQNGDVRRGAAVPRTLPRPGYAATRCLVSVRALPLVGFVPRRCSAWSRTRWTARWACCSSRLWRSAGHPPRCLRS